MKPNFLDLSPHEQNTLLIKSNESIIICLLDEVSHIKAICNISYKVSEHSLPFLVGSMCSHAHVISSVLDKYIESCEDVSMLVEGIDLIKDLKQYRDMLKHIVNKIYSNTDTHEGKDLKIIKDCREIIENG